MKKLMKEINKTYMKELNLLDPWCLMYPAKIEYIFYSNVHQNFVRLAYFLLPLTLYHQIEECNINVFLYIRK